MYCAIIGDIKGSKKIEDRDAVQEKLREVLENINSRFSDDIAAKFIITLGDEFQGLLSNLGNLVKIVKYIQKEMYPVEIRFGVGIGEITTKINKEAAIGADGPAFYAARDMLNEIHFKEKKINKQAPDFQISVYEKDDLEVEEINALLSLIKVVENGWNEQQRLTIWSMLENKESQEKCAKRMNKSQSTIARRLSDGYFVTYKNTLDTVEKAVTILGNTFAVSGTTAA